MASRLVLVSSNCLTNDSAFTMLRRKVSASSLLANRASRSSNTKCCARHRTVLIVTVDAARQSLRSFPGARRRVAAEKEAATFAELSIPAPVSVCIDSQTTVGSLAVASPPKTAESPTFSVLGSCQAPFSASCSLPFLSSGGDDVAATFQNNNKTIPSSRNSSVIDDLAARFGAGGKLVARGEARSREQQLLCDGRQLRRELQEQLSKSQTANESRASSWASSWVPRLVQTLSTEQCLLQSSLCALAAANRASDGPALGLFASAALWTVSPAAVTVNERDSRRPIAPVATLCNLFGRQHPFGRQAGALVDFSRAVHTSSAMGDRVVNVGTINQNMVAMEYAVRGPIVIRAGEIERQLKEKPDSLPFKRVIRSNIGDCQATGQKPITFIRQVLATCSLPDTFLPLDLFPSDVKERAKHVLASCGGGSAGAYSDSAGVAVVREHVAQYISKRDNVDTRAENIVLQGGASEAIRSVLSLLNQKVNGQKPGVMIPIPQYPLYSATLAEYDMGQVPYYLDEDNNWALNILELERSIQEAKKDNVLPRAICVINPGNPTGSVLTEQNIKDILKFAYEHKLMVLADEVYQHNIYIGEFHSFRKVLHNMGAPYNTLELVSFMSSSKGYMGECGLRGGYMELVNFDPAVKAVLLKAISAKLCSTVLGQVVMDCVVKPPVPGDPSYELYAKEKAFVLQQLHIKAKLVADTFNTFEGFKCNPVAGAMYAFPQFTIPPKAVEKAKSLNQKPDFFYVKQLLEETGICVVPGSGFGQRPGTYHFRTTILPPTEQLKEMLILFRDFHKRFMTEFK